jgi:hypothetical protein
MPAHIEPEQAREPKNRCDGNGREEEFGVVQERQGVVAKEGDDEVVIQGDEVEGVAEEF